jgi:signal transduction histidine kinase
MSVAIAVGGVALFASHQSEVARIDSILNNAAAQIENHQKDPLSQALLVGQESSVALTIAYIAVTGEVTVLNESRANISSAPIKSQLLEATKGAITIHTNEDIRLRATVLPDNEFVIVALPLHDVSDNTLRNIRVLGLFVLFSALLGALLMSWIIKRDIDAIEELISDATAISEGQQEVRIRPRSGNSEVVQLAKALEIMVQALKSAVTLERETQGRMKNFLGDASHELRTPLTVIKGYSELLAAGPSGQIDDNARYFERISTEVSRMEELIGDLLLLAELGETSEITSEIVAISDIVHMHANDLATLQPERPIEIAITAGLEVSGSTTLVNQLVANIFSNLHRHTQAIAKVRVRVQQDVAGIVITVDDGGTGLPMSAYTNGVGHFQRFDRSRARESGGSGLGMSIMSAIVRQHQGQFHIEQSDLGGLRTVVTLPSVLD